MKHFVFVRHLPLLMNVTFVLGVLLNAFLLMCKYVLEGGSLVVCPRRFISAED